MSFTADKQTLDDLNLLGKFKSHSIYSLFNKVCTAGGERLLEEMFRYPLTEPEAINSRSRTFRYFQEKALVFPFSREAFQQVASYLSMDANPHYLVGIGSVLRKKALDVLLRDEQYNTIYNGLRASIVALGTLRAFLRQLEIAADHPLGKQVEAIQMLLKDHRLEQVLATQSIPSLSVMAVARYDYLLRGTLRSAMQMILETIYHIDVYIAVTDVARARNFAYAKALPKEENLMHITALRHPGLEKAVSNQLFLGKESNLLFLTGANMAGKSTFMKSFGIAVYLAHMGFPVAAEEMIFSVKDGLYSSINVPDNLNMGYSHFYAEVLRVKTIAQAVSQGKNLVVIFDELFKGTNVKDAYDATLSVTAAFSAYRHCFFIISTHIIEVGEALQREYSHLQFAYLPTVMQGTVPRYTYTLTEGISSDRHGIMIIEQEKILELLQV
ncbi:DNA mismatch repair protein [Chitinophaga sp. 30R24]|uniref:MutS-related protein n=1 Tax=Chitinophaga sp. 30R24 TaxID=3248838 RepID=UPI003B8FE9FB